MIMNWTLMEAPSQTKSSGSTSGVLPKPAVLIVDDKKDGLVALEAVIQSPAHETVTVASGYEAIHQIEKRDFAVILLDVQMPKMDGFETAVRIRALEQGKD